MLLRALVLTVLVTAAYAQSAKPARIKGTVLNAKTNEPLRKAEITFVGPGGTLGAKSNAEGKFTLEDIPPGHYTMRCERLGFLSSLVKKGKGASESIDLKADQEVTDLVFKLTPQAVLAGRVVDDEGDPSPNAMVTATRKGYGSVPPVGFFDGRAVTNDLGEFRISGLSPGKWILAASPGSLQGFMGNAHSAVAGSASAKTYYPSATEASQAAPLELSAGQEMTGVELRLVRSAAVRISGRVFAPTGTPAGEASVILFPRSGRAGGSGQFAAAAKDTGDFVLRNVAPGSYNIIASARIEGERLPAAHQTIEVGNENISDVSLRLVVPVPITGQIVVDKDGKPDLKSITLNFRGDADEFATGGIPVRADGTFSAPLQPGTYRLTIGNLPEDYWLKSPRDIEITPGATELRIVIAPQAPKLNGIAKTEDGKPVAGATVAALIRDSTDLTSLVSVTADKNGQYEISLPPGEYRIYAWDTMERGALTDPDFLKRSQEKSVTVKVALGDRTALDVIAQPFPE